jgi:hypothetical protein
VNDTPEESLVINEIFWLTAIRILTVINLTTCSFVVHWTTFNEISINLRFVEYNVKIVPHHIYREMYETPQKCPFVKCTCEGLEQNSQPV